MAFFDEYSRFYRTSIVGSTPNRLNSRYQAMIQANEDCIRGLSILDLASHDGRWSFAALKAGARHVLGIEARQPLVEKSIETFAEYNITPDRFAFVNDDIFNQIPKIQPGSIDTVFCFGFFYHTMHHHYLLSQIAAFRPKHLILDTCIVPTPDPVIHVRTEITDDPGAVFASPVDLLETSLVGYPSRLAIELMLTNFGFRYRYFDWLTMPVDNWSGIEDYRDGLRVTLRADLGLYYRIKKNNLI
jgi:hypothetical protein